MNITAFAASPARPAAATRTVTRTPTASASPPPELAALCSHLGDCMHSRSRWYTLGCVGETIHGFVAPRLVTTLTLAVLLLAASTFIA